MNLIQSLWAKLPTWDDLGGRLTRKNYADQPVVNRDTDVDSQEYNSLAFATAQVARTSPFCILQASLGEGVNLVDYVKTQGAEIEVTVEVVGTGVYNLRFPTSVTDQAGRSVPTNLGLVMISCQYEDGILYPIARVMEANVVEVSVRNLAAAGALSNNLVGVSLAMWSNFL